MIGPGRAALDYRVPRVICTMFAQGGKTSAAFNIIGSILDSRPRPIMFVASTQDQILRVVEPKIDEMLRNCPSLWGKTIQGKKYTGTRKIIGGVALRLAWPTPSQMSSDSVCLVIVDEIDRINRDIRGEGGIIELADARHNTYPDGKTIGFSTPTEGNLETQVDARTGLEHWRPVEVEQVLSPVWALWQQGTRFEWSWPCPDCREYFIPRFALLTFDSSRPLTEIRAQARLACPHCGVEIPSGRKGAMNARGVYVAPGQRPVRNHGNARSARIVDHTGEGEPREETCDFGSYVLPAGYSGEDATFWVSGLANFAAKKSFGELAVAHVKAARSGDIEKVRGTINLQFGECFRFAGEAPAWTEVAARKGAYRSGEVPEWVRVLFLTVDVQANRLEYVVRGWGADLESALIETGILWGETDKRAVWRELRDLQRREFDGHRISWTAIDAGYRTTTVLDYCHRYRRTLATKGGQYEAFYKAAKVEVTRRGKLKKSSFVLWHVDADKTKQWVHSRMKLEPDEPGQWHLPGDVSEDYCRQIVGEQRLRAASGRYVWKVTGANHRLDCEALQRFLYEKEKRQIRRARPPAPPAAAEEGAAPAAVEPPTAPAPVKRARRRRFVEGFST